MGSKILVVDDEPLVLKVIDSALQKCGLEIVTKTEVHHALLFFEEHEAEIPLVLSEVRLPGMSGPQLVRAIARRSPTTLVALMSGDIGDEILDPEIPLLRKPFPLIVLRDLVDELIARQKKLVSDLDFQLGRNSHLVTAQRQIVSELQAVADLAIEGIPPPK